MQIYGPVILLTVYVTKLKINFLHPGLDQQIYGPNFVRNGPLLAVGPLVYHYWERFDGYMLKKPIDKNLVEL